MSQTVQDCTYCHAFTGTATELQEHYQPGPNQCTWWAQTSFGSGKTRPGDD